jgi:hypothetical protein
MMARRPAGIDGAGPWCAVLQVRTISQGVSGPDLTRRVSDRDRPFRGAVLARFVLRHSERIGDGPTA